MTKANRFVATAPQGAVETWPVGTLSSRRSALPVAVGLSTTFALLYAYARPSLIGQPWDSLNIGYAAETAGLHALWSNHPLGHVFYSVALDLARRRGYDGRALPLFQDLNAIVGGLNVAGMWLIFYRRLRMNSWIALGGAVIFGASAAIWFYAGTAEIYTMALLPAIASWNRLLYHAQSPVPTTPWFPGMLVGIAVLMHQQNVLLLPVALLLLGSAHQGRRGRALAAFFGVFVGVTITGYGILGHLATGSTSLWVLATWPRGYLGQGQYGGYLHLRNVPQICRTAMAIIAHPVYTTRENWLRFLLLAVTWGLTICGLLSCHRLGRWQRVVLIAALLDSVCGCVMVSWWEPFTTKYWLFVLLPSVIALMCMVSALVDVLHSSERFARVPAAGLSLFLGGSLALFNVQCTLHYDRDGNPALAAALAQWVEHSQPTDVLIPPGRLVPLLRYWENRPNTLTVFTCLWSSAPDDRFDTLSETIAGAPRALYSPVSVDDLRDNELTLLQLSRDAVKEFFAQYPQQPLFSFPSTPDGPPASAYLLSDLPDRTAGAATKRPRRTRLGPC